MISRYYKGRCWVFGDDINNDTAFMFSEENKFLTDPKQLAKYCMIGYDTNFPNKAEPGDIIVAGRNFGWGHAHDQFQRSLKGLGINLVLAESFGKDFFRVTISLGYPIPCVCGPGIRGQILEGDEIGVELSKGVITNFRTSREIRFKPFPDVLLARLDAGGTMNYVRSVLSVESGSG